VADLSGSVAGIVEGATKCEQCGATTRLANGCCVSCLLKENFEAEVEASAEVFEGVLGEAEVPDKEWRLGNYQILEEVGRGGMGVIYRARQRHSGRIVALKRVLTYHADSHETLARFRREAEAATSLDHPNILPVYEVSETEDGLPFFSMKFATGGSLRTVAAGLREERREYVRLMAKITRAIEYAHTQGILHRDLQPGNILLDARGEPMVSDFGLAKWLDEESDLTRTLTTFGTPGYIAPEQAQGAHFSSAADIYGLGAILFNLLAGRPPFIGANALSVIQQAAATPAPKLRSLVPSLDRNLETIVARCLERDPEARYQTAGGLAEDLERWLEGRPIIARPVRAPARVFRWSRRNPILASAVAACLLLGLVVGWLLREKFLAPKAPAPEKSIAVLPFENLSGNKQNSYFADGVQDEILTDLAKIADLKVISRSSVMHYKSGVERNLRKIGQELGVARVLEGSVQRSGNRVRVNAQLIDAHNDAHLWAQTYDRDLADVFAIQSEIAKAIADQLRVRLSGREEQVIAAKPTDNVEAYDAYLRGLAYSLKTVNTTANALGAQKYFKEAVRLDPKFALGWAMLSYVDAAGYRSLALQPTVALREEARQAAETALTLQPNLGEAILAKGYYHYSCLRDYDTAVRYFEQARHLLPNSSRLLESLAFLERRRGHWDRSESYFNEAERLDPRNASLLGQHAVTYLHQRRFSEALRKYDQVLNITPDDVAILAEKASIAQAEGDLPRAAALLAPLHPNADDGAALATEAYQAILERSPAQIIPRLKEILAKPDPALGYTNGELRFLLGWAQEVAGDHAAAQESWRQARSELQSFLNEQPENSLLMDDLALINMGLGDKAAAFKLIEQAIAANPIEKDALLGPKSIEVLARVAAQMGEPDRAIAALQKLLSIPCASALTVPVPLTSAVLRLDPMFDPLRNDPRFQKLAASHAPKEN
jgi:serine/threonine protein kinase/Tfp pilus assembly protein PilF